MDTGEAIALRYPEPSSPPETIVAKEFHIPDVGLTSTIAPSLCVRAVDPSAPLVHPVRSFPEIPVNETTSRALGVATSAEFCLSITTYPGAFMFVVLFKVIVVALLLIAPFKVVCTKFTFDAK